MSEEKKQKSDEIKEFGALMLNEKIGRAHV